MTPFEDLVTRWHSAAVESEELQHRAESTFIEAYLACPPNGDGKSAPEHLRKAHADHAAMDAMHQARLAQLRARAWLMRVEFAMKTSGGTP